MSQVSAARRRGPALGDRPDDQRLPAADVAGDEDTGHRGHELARRGRRCRARRPPRRGRRRSPSRWAPVKPMARKTRSAGSSRSVPSTFWNRPSTRSTSCSSSARTLPGVVAEEALGVDRVQPLAALLVGAGDPHDHRVGRPRVAVLRPAVRRRRHDLQLGDRGRALAVRGAEAVGAGVTATDDHHVLAGGVDRRVVELAERLQVAVGQVLHGQVDAGQLAARARAGRGRRWRHRPARRRRTPPRSCSVDRSSSPGRRPRRR